MASQGKSQIQLRLEHGLKARVVASAKANNRSINAEIAFQLQTAYDRNLFDWGSMAAVVKPALSFDAEIARMDSMAGNS